MDSTAQIPNAEETVAKYQDWKFPKDKSEDMLQAGQCIDLKSKKSINLCARGAIMSIKYEAEMPLRTGSHCFAYKFLRATKVWLSEDECSITVSSNYHRKLIRYSRNVVLPSTLFTLDYIG